MLKRLFKAFAPTDAEREEIEGYYREYHADSIAPLPRRVYDEFRLTGRRLGYERLYFDRRRRLSGTFMMYAARGADYLHELISLIYAICDEDTWALPAHTAGSEDIRHEIDLFAAETAMTLTELAYLMGSVLPDTVKSRIDAEVQDRVISVFERRRFGWESAEENWSAVCGGSIGMVYLYNDRPVPERVMSAMGAYLRGIAPDGACMEGLGYYSYGFGYYVYFAALLKERTGRDILNTEKVLRLSRFQSNIYLGQRAPSYSDSEPDVKPLAGLTNMLSAVFGDMPAPAAVTARNDECGRWAHYIRSFLYPAPEKTAAEGEAVYDASQIYVNRKNSFSVFVKGGHNAEPHNHNDIGSFIIADNRRQLLCDLGCGEYTRDYFDDETRYDELCCSSSGHSVPIVDGRAQRSGGQYRCGGFSAGNGRVRLEIGGAYDADVKITRELEITDRGVALCDSFSFADDLPHSVIERFVTDIKPRVMGGRTYVGCLSLDSSAEVTERIIKDHSGNDRAVYFMDFLSNMTKFAICIDISRHDVI